LKIDVHIGVAPLATSVGYTLPIRQIKPRIVQLISCPNGDDLFIPTYLCIITMRVVREDKKERK